MDIRTLREDEAVIVSKESQVQRVVRACKESHGGPIHTLAELDELVEANKTEENLASALNLEIRYRKFTCLLKVATNNELFKQRGISNKERITHLKQLLSDDTRPKCHATISDIEALYEQDIVTTSSSAASSTLLRRKAIEPPHFENMTAGFPLRCQNSLR